MGHAPICVGFVRDLGVGGGVVVSLSVVTLSPAEWKLLHYTRSSHQAEGARGGGVDDFDVGGDCTSGADCENHCFVFGYHSENT